jgi:amino-acid N-acetyltransferase
MTHRIRRAGAADLEAVLALLRQAALPTDGVAEHFDRFWVLDIEGAVAGAVGLEVYGDSGLIRSLVVRPELRGQGQGRNLYFHLLNQANGLSLEQLILLTTSAREFFEKLGYEVIPRDRVPPAMLQSREFQGACPESAVCMRIPLM